jgi:hypothetical protein
MKGWWGTDRSLLEKEWWGGRKVFLLIKVFSKDMD